LRLRPGSSDFATFREIFIDREYDAVHAFATPPIGVLDLGANIGLTARWLRQQFPSLRVMCVEPDSRNSDVAATNLEAAVASGEVVMLQAFAGGTPRAAWIDSAAHGLTNEHRLSDRPRRAATTPVYTVGDLLARCQFPIDTVKMDVEGSEREIFESDLSWLSVVRDVLVEVHAPLDEAWLRRVLPAGGPAHVRKVLYRHAGAFVAWVTCRP
jgi:FkbM family methyltransferase